MKLFIMSDGTKISARNAHDLIKQMRAIGAPSGNEREFMHDVAERAKMQDHTAVIPTDSADKFVAALLRCGFIKAVENE